MFLRKPWQNAQRRDRLQAQTDQHERLVEERDRAIRKASADLGIPVTGAIQVNPRIRERSPHGHANLV